MKRIRSLILVAVAISLTGCTKQAEDLYNKFFGGSQSEPFDSGYFIFVDADNKLSCEETKMFFGNCCQGDRFSIDENTNILVQLSHNDEFTGERVEFRTKEACESAITDIKSKLKLASGKKEETKIPEDQMSHSEPMTANHENTQKPFFMLSLSEFKASFPQASCFDFQSKGTSCVVKGGAFSPALSEAYSELKCDQINKEYGAHFVDGIISYGFCNIPFETFQSFLAEGKLIGKPKSTYYGELLTNVYAFDMGMKKMEFRENIGKTPSGEPSVYYVAHFNTNPL